jgi:hypothetical protein
MLNLAFTHAMRDLLVQSFPRAYHQYFGIGIEEVQDTPSSDLNHMS